MSTTRSSFAWVAFQLTNSFKREFVAPNIVKLHVPGGFPYEAFDGNAHIKPWSLLNLVESGRAFSFNPNKNDPHTGFLDFYHTYKVALAFIASSSLTISPDLYDKDISKSPLVITKKLVYVGKSSLNIETEISHPEIERPFAVCQVQSVCVDRETRKPRLMPEWWNEKYQQYSQKDRALKWTLEHSRPSTFISYALVVQASDCDAYSHTNWSSYLKFCCDALVSGESKKDQSSLTMPCVKSYMTAYVKECNSVEKLSVDFWPAPDNSTCFEILNETNDVVCRAQLETF